MVGVENSIHWIRSADGNSLAVGLVTLAAAWILPGFRGGSDVNQKYPVNLLRKHR
jgi:hypothetical protein